MKDLEPTRIGDAERDAAVESLRDHLVAGRLTHTEFDERMNAALNARFRSELSPLFADLPKNNELSAASSAVIPGTPAPPPAARVDLRPIYSAVVWLGLVGLIVWTGGSFWWLIFFAGGITGAIYRDKK